MVSEAAYPQSPAMLGDRRPQVPHSHLWFWRGILPVVPSYSTVWYLPAAFRLGNPALLAGTQHVTQMSLLFCR